MLKPWKNNVTWQQSRRRTIVSELIKFNNARRRKTSANTKLSREHFALKQEQESKESKRSKLRIVKIN